MQYRFIALISLSAAAAAAPAWGLGQCFDRAGRPIGPTFDIEQPDYNFIRSVYARGGSCLSMDDTARPAIAPPTPPPPGTAGLPAPTSGSLIYSGPYLYNAYYGVISYSGPWSWINGSVLISNPPSPVPSTILHSRPPANSWYPPLGVPGYVIPGTPTPVAPLPPRPLAKAGSRALAVAAPE
jgi:hypothetical protein